ncbi:hypothetical protein STEG23_008151 [Scotinomys teguina]
MILRHLVIESLFSLFDWTLCPLIGYGSLHLLPSVIGEKFCDDSEGIHWSDFWGKPVQFSSLREFFISSFSITFCKSFLDMDFASSALASKSSPKWISVELVDKCGNLTNTSELLAFPDNLQLGLVPASGRMIMTVLVSQQMLLL